MCIYFDYLTWYPEVHRRDSKQTNHLISSLQHLILGIDYQKGCIIYLQKNATYVYQEQQSISNKSLFGVFVCSENNGDKSSTSLQSNEIYYISHKEEERKSSSVQCVVR